MQDFIVTWKSKSGTRGKGNITAVDEATARIIFDRTHPHCDLLSIEPRKEVPDSTTITADQRIFAIGMMAGLVSHILKARPDLADMTWLDRAIKEASLEYLKLVSQGEPPAKGVLQRLIALEKEANDICQQAPYLRRYLNPVGFAVNEAMAAHRAYDHDR